MDIRPSIKDHCFVRTIIFSAIFEGNFNEAGEVLGDVLLSPVSLIYGVRTAGEERWLGRGAAYGAGTPKGRLPSERLAAGASSCRYDLFYVGKSAEPLQIGGAGFFRARSNKFNYGFEHAVEAGKKSSVRARQRRGLRLQQKDGPDEKPSLHSQSWRESVTE